MTLSQMHQFERELFPPFFLKYNDYYFNIVLEKNGDIGQPECDPF